MVRQHVNDRQGRSAIKSISKRELFEACDSILAMQNATSAVVKPRDVQNSASATESVGGNHTPVQDIKLKKAGNEKNEDKTVTKPVYIPEPATSQNTRNKRIPEGEELAKIIVKDGDANVCNRESDKDVNSRSSQSKTSVSKSSESKSSVSKSSVSKSSVSKSTSHSSSQTNNSTRVDAVDLEEKSGRKLQSLEQDNDNLGFEEIDFKKTIEPGLGKDEVDNKSIWSEISYYMKKDFRYYFQHPYSRLFVAYFVTVCNFLIFAEDPVAHSRKKAVIPVVGNVFALVGNYYPPNAWSLAKIAVWILAITCGMLIGKLVIHRLLLARLMRLRMFRDDQGSWMIMFLTVLFMLFLASYLLNLIYLIGGDSVSAYKVTDSMGIENATFMKAAACGTWMGDFVTAWMVTDMMLQDKLYPGWAVRLRKFWNRGYNRIILFWVVWVTMTVVVVLIISTDWVSWDSINHDLLVSNEVSRAYLASFILIMDLLIVMQDWDFPHFEANFDIKLPGVNTSQFHFRLPACLRRDEWRIHITGKWFNYGIIFLVMILDLNMWKNQIFYAPYDYGQYTDSDGRVITVTDDVSLNTHNESLMHFAWRSVNTNPLTDRFYSVDDFQTNSRFYNYSFVIKATAFIPSISMFVVFGVFIWWYGRWKPDPNDPHAGRLFKRKKKKRKEAVRLTKVTTIDSADGKKSGYTNRGAEVEEGKF